MVKVNMKTILYSSLLDVMCMMSVIGLMYFTYVRCITTQYPVHQQISLLMKLHVVINPICLLTKHWISAPFPQHRISLIHYGEAGRKLLTPSHRHMGSRRSRQISTGAHWSYRGTELSSYRWRFSAA